MISVPKINILNRVVNYLTYIEGLSLEMSGSFSRGRKTELSDRGLKSVVITLSPSKTDNFKTDSKSGPEGVHLRGNSL